MKLHIQVHRQNGDPKGRRLVVVRDGKSEIHRDKIDVDQAFLRQQFIGKVAQKLGADDGAFEYLDQQIVAAAGDADRQHAAGALPALERLTSEELDDGDFQQRYLV